MPTYEYECRSCHHRFEKLQSITAKPTAPCPRCRKGARRLISTGTGLLFKGSGFYATDYRSSGYKKKAESESKGCSPAPKGPPAGGCGKPGCQAPKD